MHNLAIKCSFTAISGLIGWFFATFEPAFNLLIVAIGFILWDVQSAWALDRRVHIMYPDKVKRKKAAFQSFKLTKTIKTIKDSATIIFLMYALHKWVFVEFWDIPLEHISTAIICGWQFLSVMENNASCPTDGRRSKFWAMLRRNLIDKTERHFDINIEQNNNENIQNN